MRKIIKPTSLLPISVALFSFSVYLGGVLGYFSAKFYCTVIYGKKVGNFLTLKSILLPLGKYKIHLHHWLYSFLILIVTIIYDISFLQSHFIMGFLAGLILEDIFHDKNWYRIIKKKEICL